MSNTILTPTAVTREALRILHQKLNFVGSIDRQYDDSFAKDGAKIGDRPEDPPAEPLHRPDRRGPGRPGHDRDQHHADGRHPEGRGPELHLHRPDAEPGRLLGAHLEPAMSVLAANIEYDAMSMYKDVYQASGTRLGHDHRPRPAARKKLNDALTPGSSRTANLSTQQMVDAGDGRQGAVQDSKEISKQYKEGYVGRAAGFDFVENTLWPAHTAGR
jgi:hypothetical protein